MSLISHLSNLKPQTPIDLSMYKAAQPKPFPRAGRYTVRAPEAFTPESFTEAKSSGALVARIDPTIVGGENDGYQIRGTRVSAKSYTDSKGRTTSQMASYVAATGDEGEFPQDPEAQAQSVAATAGKLYEVTVDWELEDRNSGFKLRGMENFPKDASGNPTRYVTLDGTNGTPKVLDPITNEPVTARAFLTVRWFNRLRQ